MVLEKKDYWWKLELIISSQTKTAPVRSFSVFYFANVWERLSKFLTSKFGKTEPLPNHEERLCNIVEYLDDDTTARELDEGSKTMC